MQFVLKYKQAILLGIILVFHTVGVFGLTSSERNYFLSLSPLNLLLSLGCLFLSYKHVTSKLAFDILIVGALGFTAEWIGVHTGYLFGDYTYGSNLGYKLDGIPLMIAANWVMLSFSTIAIVMNLKANIFIKAIVSAALMTGMDVLIEPVAISSDFWSWANGVIPLYNYICWFGVSFVLHLYLLKRGSIEQNTVAIGLFVTLMVFFGILNII